MADVIENNLVDVNVPAKNLMLRLRAYADEIERLRAAINTETLKDLLDRYEAISLSKIEDEDLVENDDGKIMRYTAIGRTETGFCCGYGEDLQGAIDELSGTIDELRALKAMRKKPELAESSESATSSTPAPGMPEQECVWSSCPTGRGLHHPPN